MRKRRCQFAITLAVLLLLVIGCSSQNQETPLPETAFVSLLDTPAVASTLPPVEYTPDADSGIVQGVLSLDDQPAPERVLYLAGIISSGEEVEMAALDPVNDPRTASDQAGRFAFLDISPGRYALGINSPAGPVLIRGGDGDEIVAEVKPGEVVDLGTVVIVPFE